ncbi:MAG: septation protein IspZ [Caulobacterales bacterium]|nr:septation protein IspZ [Caulobacterales bacterium]
MNIENKNETKSGFDTVRIISDLGPALAFFIGYFLAPKLFPADPITHEPKPILIATLFFLPVSVLTFIFSWVKTRKISPIAMFTFVMILIMSGLGLWLKNDIFIKMRPTLIYSLMGLILIYSVIVRNNLLKTLFDSAIHMDDVHWRTLALRAGILNICLAILNEIMWRLFSEKTWVLYNMWGDVAINLAFWIINIMALSKYMTDENGKPLLEDEKA